MGVIRLATAILSWGAAMYGALLIQHVQFPGTHTICGPWGCGTDRLEALIAYHSFWLVLLGGGAFLITNQVPAKTVSQIGYWIAMAGLAALIMLGVWDFSSYLPQTAHAPNRYLVQRYLFVVVTQADVPAVQLLLVGMGSVLRGMMANRASSPSDSFPRAEERAAAEEYSGPFRDV